uniref:Uncharacterized protein n=1 Tax=Oryza meridionalis TaxID=40149 RepID=A0A0E0EQ27_9ORYZ
MDRASPQRSPKNIEHIGGPSIRTPLKGKRLAKAQPLERASKRGTKLCIVRPAGRLPMKSSLLMTRKTSRRGRKPQRAIEREATGTSRNWFGEPRTPEWRNTNPRFRRDKRRNLLKCWSFCISSRESTRAFPKKADNNNSANPLIIKVEEEILRIKFVEDSLLSVKLSWRDANGITHGVILNKLKEEQRHCW